MQSSLESPLHLMERMESYSGPSRSPLRLLAKVRSILALEWSNVHPRIMLANAIVFLIPRGAGYRLRTLIYRHFVGLQIGRGTMIAGPIIMRGMGNPYKRITIGEDCLIASCRVVLNAHLTIGNNVCVNEEVVINTDTHEVGPPQRRMGHIVPKPVTIGDGCWITQRTIIQAGVTIGPGCVIGNAAVVSRDIPANSFAGGVPAKVIRSLDKGESPLAALAGGSA